MKAFRLICTFTIFWSDILVDGHRAFSQENFQIKWTMDYTQAGVSDHQNFTPANAVLGGGPNTYTLPTVYSAGGAIGMGYVTRPWPAAFSAGRYMEFAFTANSFKYDISRISFRLRRSNNGAKQVKVRSSADSYANDLQTDALAKPDIFYTYTIPVSYKNLSDNTFGIRIYGFDAADIHGTFWFDEIVIAGKVLAIILPMRLTSFTAAPQENAVQLKWQTSWEQGGKAFLIERSDDLKSFETIGSIRAEGDTTGVTNYSFNDPSPYPGPNYYRLRIVDRDDSFTFSQVTEAIVDSAPRAILAIPNPAPPEKITISGNISSPEAIALQTLSGRPIPVKRAVLTNKNLVLEPEQPVPSGVYVVTFVENGRKEHVKILVR